MAGRARFLDVHRERLARAVKGLVERDLDARLDVPAAGAAAPAPLEEVFESHALASGPAAPACRVAEDGAEELREIPGVAEVAPVLDSEPSAGGPGRSLGVALPVRSKRVVAVALLGIGEDLVGFADLLEAFGRVLALGDVGMVFPREPSIGGLDRLVVGLPIDS